MGKSNKLLTIPIMILLVISFSSVFSMCCSDIDGSSLNEEIITSDNLKYEVIKEGTTSIPGEVSLIGSVEGKSRTGKLTIPEQIEYNRIRYDVTLIGDGAFSGCSGLTGQLIIPNSVRDIDADAFNGCSGLTGPLTIPNSVKNVIRDAFNGCYGFEALAVGTNVMDVQYAFEGWIFYDSDGTTQTSEIIGKVFEGSTTKMVEKENKWMVTCCDGNGSLLDYFFFDRGATIDNEDLPLPPNPGFILRGWETDDGPVIMPHQVNDNEIIRPIWEREWSIKMLFVDIDGSEIIGPMFFNRGDTFKMPGATKGGYQFEGWKDSEGNIWKCQDQYEVKGDMIFTAKWTETPQPQHTDEGISPIIVAVICIGCIFIGCVSTFFVMRNRL